MWILALRCVIIASYGVKIYENKELNCSRWQNDLLQCPAGTNKAGPFSPSKSPALAEMTDLQLRHGPNSNNYIRYVILHSCTAVLWEGCKGFRPSRENRPVLWEQSQVRVNVKKRYSFSNNLIWGLNSVTAEWLFYLTQIVYIWSCCLKFWCFPYCHSFWKTWWIIS